jgi:hypothetical protein
MKYSLSSLEKVIKKFLNRQVKLKANDLIFNSVNIYHMTARPPKAQNNSPDKSRPKGSPDLNPQPSTLTTGKDPSSLLPGNRKEIWRVNQLLVKPSQHAT